MAIDGSTQRKMFEETITPQYIDKGWAWVIVFASFGINLVNMGVMCALGVIHSQILKEFNEGNAYTSLILSLMSTCSSVISPLTSYLVGKFGYRSVTIAGALLGTISLLVSYYAQNVLTLIVTIGFGYGFGMGLMYLPSSICFIAYFEKYRSTAAGIVATGSAVGIFICTPLAAHLSQEYGWRLTFVYLSVLMSTCAVFGSLFRPIESLKIENDSLELNHAYGEKQLSCVESLQNEFDLQKLEVASNVYTEEPIESTALDLIRDPIIMLMSVASATLCIGYYVPYLCLTDRATEVGMTKQEGSYLISIIGVSNIFGRLFWGFISDKPFVNRLWVYIGSLIISGSATIVCVFGTNFLELVVYSTVFGFIISAYVSLQSVVLSDVVGVDKLNNAFGIILLCEGIGSFIGPLGVGFFHDLKNSYLHGFIFGGVFIVLSGILTCFIPTLQKTSHDNRNYKEAAQL